MTGVPASERLCSGLFDDAAIFPPGNAAMTDAVVAHGRHEAAWYARFVGPLLCSERRLGELLAALPARPVRARPLRLGLIVTGGAAALEPALRAVARREDLDLAGVEVPVAGDAGDLAGATRRAAAAIIAATSDGAPPAFVEIPPGPAAAGALDVLAGCGLGAKLRTGGTSAAAFPSEREVAAFLRDCVDRGLRFKCTAGLHHAVRHTDRDTGLEHHGFLNVLLAVAHAIGGGAVEDLVETLAERDDQRLARAAGSMDGHAAAAVRERFHSFGTCSIAEPIDDLLALGLLEQPRRADPQR